MQLQSLVKMTFLPRKIFICHNFILVLHHCKVQTVNIVNIFLYSGKMHILWFWNSSKVTDNSEKKTFCKRIAKKNKKNVYLLGCTPFLNLIYMQLTKMYKKVDGLRKSVMWHLNDNIYRFSTRKLITMLKV